MKTFFRPEMTAYAGEYSLSPLKPKLMTDWIAKQYPDSIHSFEPATIEQIKLAHDPVYVDNVFALKEPNGFGNVKKEVAESLPYTVGSMIAAVRDVASRDCFRGTALSPTSGFHHASYGHGGGFCTFNGLIIALLVAKQEGLIDTATIIDGDEHWGDGTDNIIRKLKLDWITHWSSNAYGDEYVTEFKFACQEAFTKRGKRHITIYQAGADIHVKDPLGGRLTTEQMRQRDNYLRGYVGKAGKVVWNLAGGYQVDNTAISYEDKLEPVMALHRQTYEILRVEDYD